MTETRKKNVPTGSLGGGRGTRTLGTLARTTVFEPASGHTIRRRTIARGNDPVRQTIAETFRIEVFGASGEVIAETETSFVVRWACRQEMAYLFELSGFEVVEQYSDFDRAPPVYCKRQIWVVRRR